LVFAPLSRRVGRGRRHTTHVTLPRGGGGGILPMSGSEDENDSDAERQNGNGAEEDLSPLPFRPAGMRPAGSMRPGRRGSSPAVFGGGMLGRLQ